MMRVALRLMASFGAAVGVALAGVGCAGGWGDGASYRDGVWSVDGTELPVEGLLEVSAVPTGREGLTVEVGPGDITVREDAGVEEISARVEFFTSSDEELAALRLSLDSEGGQRVLRLRNPDRIGQQLVVVTRVDVVVPAGVGPLLLDTGSGDIEVRGGGREGTVSELDTGSGSVTVRDLAGALDADTGSGVVDVERVGGRVSADTGSGDVRVVDAGGEVWVDTGSGSVRVLNAAWPFEIDTGSGGVLVTVLEEFRSRVGLVYVDVGSGSVTARGVDLGRGGPSSVDTGSGDVTVELALPE